MKNTKNDFEFFFPVVYIQNDQRVMGIILRYVCWGYPPDPPPPPAPGSPAADRPTRRPSRFGSTRGQPPLQPLKRLHTPWGHALAGGSPCGNVLLRNIEASFFFRSRKDSSPSSNKSNSSNSLSSNRKRGGGGYRSESLFSVFSHFSPGFSVLPAL